MPAFLKIIIISNVYLAEGKEILQQQLSIELKGLFWRKQWWMEVLEMRRKEAIRGVKKNIIKSCHMQNKEFKYD